jgi:transcriptional regulator with XRE-family HTH domain
MTKKFNTLLNRMSEERQTRIKQRVEAAAREMALHEVRQARHLTQQKLAGTLRVNQAAISKLEHQSDMYISTLRRVLAAMGGTLKIVAHFPEGEIVIRQFEDLSPAVTGRPKT